MNHFNPMPLFSSSPQNASRFDIWDGIVNYLKIIPNKFCSPSVHTVSAGQHS